MRDLVVVRYDNSGYQSFNVMTLEEFKVEEKTNYIEHEPCYLSSLEELQQHFNSLSPDSELLQYYSELISKVSK